MESSDKWIGQQMGELTQRYAGKFVAVVDGKVVGVSQTAREADYCSRVKFPNQVPRLFYVPGNDGGELFLKMVLKD